MFIAVAETRTASAAPSAAWWVLCTIPPWAMIAAGSNGAPTASLAGSASARAAGRR